METKTATVIAKFHRMVPDGSGGERKENFEIGQTVTEPAEVIDNWVANGLVEET